MRRSGMAEINHQSRNALPEQQPTFCLCRAPSPRLRVVAPIPWAREKAPAGRRPGTEFLYRWFRAGITAIFWDGSAPRGTAGRSSSDRGVAPGASLGALENKPGMSFSFMGIVLATPLSIQDSPPLRRVDWRRRLRDAGEEEPDSRSAHPAPIFIAKQSQQLIENTGERPEIGQNKAKLGHFSAVPLGRPWPGQAPALQQGHQGRSPWLLSHPEGGRGSPALELLFVVVSKYGRCGDPSCVLLQSRS